MGQVMVVMVTMMVTMTTTERKVMAHMCGSKKSLVELVGGSMVVYTSVDKTIGIKIRRSTGPHTCLDMIIFAIDSGSFDWYIAGTEKKKVQRRRKHKESF